VQNISASAAAETDYEASFPRESLSSENVAEPVTEMQPSQSDVYTDSQYEEAEPTATASDEDSDSDDTSRHRDRFRTERKSTTTKLMSAHSNNAEKRSIPDTLGETQSHTDIRYYTIHYLHRKTDRQAASLI